MTIQTQLDKLSILSPNKYVVNTASGTGAVILDFYDKDGYYLGVSTVTATVSATTLLSLYRTAVGSAFANFPDTTNTIYLTNPVALTLAFNGNNDGTVSTIASPSTMSLVAGFYRLGYNNIKDGSLKSIPLWAYCFKATSASSMISGVFLDRRGVTLSDVSFAVSTSASALGALVAIPDEATGFILGNSTSSVYWNTGGGPGNTVIVTPNSLVIPSGLQTLGFGDQV